MGISKADTAEVEMFQVLKNGRTIGAPVATGDKAIARVAQLRSRVRVGETATFEVRRVS